MILEPSLAETAIADSVAAFVRDHLPPAIASAIDERDEFPRELVGRAAEQGLAGLSAPTDAGGLRVDGVASALAIEALARASGTLAAILAVHNALVVEPLGRFGSRDQQARWLAPLASGRAIGAFALAEPESGIDPAHARTTAAVAPDGTFTLNGRKAWVANGTAADLALIVAAVGEASAPAVFLVPLDHPGVSRVALEQSVGLRGLGCVELRFEQVRLEPDATLGGLPGGASVVDWALNRGRIAVAALATGLGASALDEAVTYARRRESHGQPIASYQGVQFMLADMATELDAARMLMLKAASEEGGIDQRTMDAAMAALYASEAACRITETAMRVLASAAFRRGSVVERLFRDARGSLLLQGTPDRHRMTIAAGIVGYQ
jgi:alkylation response protein AidB-like acyl-CoA dehydrogenase